MLLLLLQHQVLDTFAYADKEFLQAFPDLMQAKVYVHFQSDVQVRQQKQHAAPMHCSSTAAGGKDALP
jgi:hypothetical protein